MDNNNGNRFYLNLGETSPQDPRWFPTTPSTFPNPVFPTPGQQAQYGQQQPPYSTGNAPSGYFMSNPYPSAYPAQPPSSNYHPSPQASTPYQQRSAAPSNDPTNGLAHQLSHQNLGGGRQSPYGQRQNSPSQRPRTAGATGQQAGYGSYLSAPMPSQMPQQQQWPEYQTAPQRDPDRYGTVTHNNQKKTERMASDFFKDSVKRARDRNVRYVMRL